MKTFCTLAIISITMTLAIPVLTFAQPAPVEEQVTFTERNLGGPRIGITFIPGDNALTRELAKSKIKNTLSQFGWHFEYVVAPQGGGPAFVVEFVPLVAGVEYGTLIPSATLALGIRLPSGIEFGVGPNILMGPKASTALVVAVGKSFNYSGVSIPLNFVWVTNPAGNRFGIMFGYSIGK